MLRKETHFEIRNLSGPRLLKVITVDELIDQGSALCGDDADFSDLLLWLPEDVLQANPQLLSLPVGGFLTREALLAATQDGPGSGCRRTWGRGHHVAIG